MKRKKVILIIVEGPSDETALQMVLERTFSNNRVFVAVAYGDVTSDERSTPSNIVKRVHEIVKKNMNRNHYLKQDMLQVIHLMDSDGAYIPDDAVVEVVTATQTLYNATNVIAPDRLSILERNKRKSANMDRLATLPTIAGIPYYSSIR